jgi:hypothetical protein
MDRGPNLLFIYTDEQAHRTIAAYGNPRIETPNLNRLAAESLVFERAYVTQPVCTPSRSRLTWHATHRARQAERARRRVIREGSACRLSEQRDLLPRGVSPRRTTSYIRHPATTQALADSCRANCQ